MQNILISFSATDFFFENKKTYFLFQKRKSGKTEQFRSAGHERKTGWESATRNYITFDSYNFNEVLMKKTHA